MSTMNQQDVEEIAIQYLMSTGFAPFVVDGSEFDDKEDPPIWRVFISFREFYEEEIGLPALMVVQVNDLTGLASHEAML